MFALECFLALAKELPSFLDIIIRYNSERMMNMKKTLIALSLLAAMVIAVAACAESTGAPAYVEPAMEGTTIAEAAEPTTESVTVTDAASEAAADSASAGTTKPVTTAESNRSAATITAQRATAKATTQAATRSTAPTTQSTTSTTRSTTTTRSSTTTTTTAAPRPQTQPPKPVYTEADYAEIIAAVRTYAENEMKLPFVWDTTLTYEYAKSGRAGFHDVVNLTLYGKEFVINELKYHCDLTDNLASGAHGGVPSTEL